jgi:hypothetical protein
MCFCRQLALISVQNTRLDAGGDDKACAALAGTETASFNFETFFIPTT